MILNHTLLSKGCFIAILPYILTSTHFQGKKKRFIDKKNAVSFRLVHRSQRDPLQADEDSSKHVLLPVGDSESSHGHTDQVGIKDINHIIEPLSLTNTHLVETSLIHLKCSDFVLYIGITLYLYMNCG